MLNKTKAIVLHHVKYGDTSLIVQMYTEKYGRISCIVNGVRSKKSKSPFSSFQPLTILDIEIYYRHNHDIQRIKESSVLQPYQTIPFQVTKSTVALFIAEILFFSLREEESNPPLFSFLLHALIWYDTSEKGLSVFHHWFIFHLSRFLGFIPAEHILESDNREYFAHLSEKAIILLKKIAAESGRPPDVSGFAQKERNELLSELLKYYTQHMDGFKIKSYNILQDVFND